MRRLLVCTLGALVFVGCGDGSGSDPAAHPSTTAAVTLSAPTATPIVVAPSANPSASPSVAATPAEVAWAAGGNSLLRSDDGGFHWRDTGRGASGLAFVTRDVGWIFSEGGQLSHTVDGGRTWTDQVPNIVGAAPVMLDLATVDGIHAVVVGGAPRLDITRLGPPAALYTADAGATWIPAALPPFDPDLLADVDLLSACLTASGLGLATGTDIKNFTTSIVLLTHDGGRSWDDITDRLPHRLFAQVACGTDGRLWFLGAESTVMVSADGGASWEDHGAAFPPHRTLEGGVFLADGVAWLAALDAPPGHRLLAYRSDDGGESWAEHVIAPEVIEIEKLGLAALDGAHAVVVAQDEHPLAFPRSSFGRSWVTIDGGATWAATEHPEPIDALWDVALVP